MAISQNARFSGSALTDAEFEHPPGAAIARNLREALVQRGWEVSEIDDWRDSGWSFTCCRPALQLEVSIAKTSVGEVDEWFLQIAPTYVPGLIGRVLCKAASASPEAVQVLARDLFAALSEIGQFGNFMWCWDGTPDEENSSPEPVPARAITDSSS
jgi:hypothetical protein